MKVVSSKTLPAVQRLGNRVRLHVRHRVLPAKADEEGAVDLHAYDAVDVPASYGPEQQAAAVRYFVETSGLDLDGIRIATDDRSKTLIVGKWNRAQMAKREGDEQWSCKFKTPAGWVELSADQMIAIGLAVEDHVQRCFDREGEIVAAIQAGEHFDLGGGWPE
jgi:hypothetical protein